MDKKKHFPIFLRPAQPLFDRELTTIGRERLSLLLYCYLPVMAIGIGANLLCLTEPSAPFFTYTHTVLLAAAAVTLAFFIKHKIDVTSCLTTFTIIGQTVVSIEMIYCAFHPSPYYSMLIMANTVLLAMNTTISMAAYLKNNTIVLGIATMGVYIACSFISGDDLLSSFIAVFAIAFCFISLANVWMVHTTDKLEKQNERFRKDEMEMLFLLRLKKDEVKAYLQLASERLSHDGTKILLERLDTKARDNMLKNVEEYIKNRKTDLEAIEKAFPEFTPSEREICRLILQGKKLRDIHIILCKTESNINSQRANMRKKLGLESSDNLLKKMQQRLDESNE